MFCTFHLLIQMSEHFSVFCMQLSETEQSAYKNYIDFRTLMQKWEAENKNLFALSESDLKELENYSKNPDATAGDAIALLKLNGIDTYREPVYFPKEEELKPRENNDITYVEDVISEDKLFIYPNPADKYITVEYAVTVLNNRNLSLVITDLSGKQVYEEKLFYPQDEIIITAQQFPQGQYFCTLRNDNHVIKTNKFILVK